MSPVRGSRAHGSPSQPSIFAAESLPPAYPRRAARGTAGSLRAWQAAALAKYLSAMPQDFLAVATPGAGKTAFALRAATELLAAGDRRNVVDRYRYWTVAAIRADLAARSHRLHIAIENVSQDLNIGSIVRSANAFNVAGVHIIGRRRWNKRGAMVTNRYLDVRHHPEPGELLDWAAEDGYEVIGIDNGPGAQPLEGATLPERCLMVFGSEGEGISAELSAGCSRLLRIGQYGSTRSINVAAAAAVAMHTWILQHAGPAPD